MARSSTGTAAQKAAADVVDTRLAHIRELAETDVASARTEAWAWIAELSHRAGTKAKEADAELGQLFRLGEPSTAIDGPTEGMLVNTRFNPLVDAGVRAVTGGWMPWQGKRFDRANARGDNRLVRSSVPLARLMWPTYSFRRTTDGWLAFDFETRVEPGVADPDVNVLVLDYASVRENPNLIIRAVRDEIVELVDGVHLGKIHFKTGKDSYAMIGYFAVREQG